MTGGVTRAAFVCLVALSVRGDGQWGDARVLMRYERDSKTMLCVEVRVDDQPHALVTHCGVWGSVTVSVKRGP